MITRPSPVKLALSISLENVDVGWENLVNLELNCTPLNGVLQVIRDALLLEICTLVYSSLPIAGVPTIIRHPQLRTLRFVSMRNDIFTTLIDSLELPSLESWRLSSANVISVDNIVSFLKRSACSVKMLRLRHDI